MRGQGSGVRGQGSEVRGQWSEVRGQRSEVRGQRSGVGEQRSVGSGRWAEVGGRWDIWVGTGGTIRVSDLVCGTQREGVGSRFRATINHMEDALSENDSRPLGRNAFAVPRSEVGQ